MTKTGQKSQGLLLFKLNERQTFALGTLKVREIVPYQPLTVIPKAHPTVLGSAPIRGNPIPVIDMAAAVGYRPIQPQELPNCFIIVTDCHRQLIGFMVRKIERIIECDWRDITPMPSTSGKNIFVSGVTDFDSKLIQLLDTEMLISHIFPVMGEQLYADVTHEDQQLLRNHRILVVDDSAVARKQLSDALNYAGIPFECCGDGRRALGMMREAAATNQPFHILVSDIEMPGLNGYELTFEVRSDPRLAGSYVILHTSLSSEMSLDQAHQVGANEALTKFDAAELLHGMLRGALHVNSGTVVSGVASKLVDV
ncbi:chemotaxis protein [Gallaecimonas xiamenensis]|uniref:Chemotaxis protein CheV n=1 Tax=Gallaecimonas xiamenensis 3-C-1 TaxID=745411 RepID=K2KKF5_9GAMM|nr:chemotaxis protein [Gallaecimonas xiamenensis]EKE77880.1 chemotaxis protein CheV [Gallaecimonas xiamenensis 3-C-1]